MLDALVPEGIVPVLLKGYGLAARLYPQPLGRPSSDVDLLVTREQVAAVEAVLARLGLNRFVDDSLGDVFEDHHHVAFTGPGGLVEVHFKLTSGLGIDVDDSPIVQRAVVATLDGRAVRYLQPEDEFVYLSTHAANHAFLRLSWLVDLQLFLLKYPTLDWPQMRATADALGSSASVSAALVVLEQCLEVRLDEAARRAFLSGRWRSLPNSLIFSPSQLTSAALAQKPLSNFLLRLWLVDSPLHALRHVAGGATRSLRRKVARRWA